MDWYHLFALAQCGVRETTLETVLNGGVNE